MSTPPVPGPGGRGAVPVRDAELAAHGERLLAAPHVEVHELALAFDESSATAAAVHVGGTSFFPRMLADVERASSSVHIVQFGFRPGNVGDRFAEALVAKARDGVPVRLVVDRNGSDPERGSRAFYDRLVAGGVQVCMASGTQARGPFGPLGAERRPVRWNVRALGHIDHRKAVVVDGRIGWVGGAGIEDHFEDGRFHDLFVRLEGPVVSQLQLVFLASLRRLGGSVPTEEVDALFPAHDPTPEAVPAIVLHNAPGRFRPITEAIAASLESARETLDVVNPYVTDRGMIRRIEAAARRGARVRLFVPATPNNWACGLAERFHHGHLLDAGVQILEYPAMLHAKAFVRDGEEVLAGTCNLEAWSLKRFFEIDVRVRSRALAEQFDERFAVPAVDVSAPGRRATGVVERAKATAFAALSPLL
ncbi:MAG TPA: phosphatidylserine/phosphatidylglycerophosphate/cardiolipin synthase family protein [Gaiellaceae bacterium]|nr:phosphatidylserine/phosphatidylglycerophosphate/cardiolipin synthase family protein [Gaiellaceae bacterium]